MSGKEKKCDAVRVGIVRVAVAMGFTLGPVFEKMQCLYAVDESGTRVRLRMGQQSLQMQVRRMLTEEEKKTTRKQAVWETTEAKRYSDIQVTEKSIEGITIPKIV